MHESRGLERVAGWFVRHARRGEVAQLIIDERQKLIRGLGIAAFDALQDERDLTGGGRGRLRRSAHSVKSVGVGETAVASVPARVPDSISIRTRRWEAAGVGKGKPERFS